MATTAATAKSNLPEGLQHFQEENSNLSSCAWARIHPDFWVLHGKYYDLNNFIKLHPGGVENMELGRGRDCTELFESIHSLSKLDMHSILKKYEIPIPSGYDAPFSAPFLYEKDGFYSVLKKRVSSHFETVTNGSRPHKGTWTYWFKVSLLFVLWFLFSYCALRFASITFSILASAVMGMSGFCIMHDASHYACSKKPWVNQFMHIIWSDWNFWPHFNWMRHHVYGHHSYTGIYKRDPDLVNSSSYVRKHPNQVHKKRFETQHIHVWFLLGFAPNQHLGQSLIYLQSIFTGKVFTVPILKLPMIDILTYIPITIISFYLQFIFPFHFVPLGRGFLMILIYWTTMGLGYMANVIPNHDTLDTHNSALKHGELRDWGAQQVCATGNHSTDGGIVGRIVTTCFGGMNYQIEHHLFPSMSHVHYPKVAKIVQETCKEFKLPYVTHSWLTALWRFGELTWMLSFEEVGRSKESIQRSENAKIE